jgi:xylulokinase
MTRAIIEGLNYQFLQIVNAFETGLGINPQRIVTIGGATKNKFWMQNKADIVGKPIQVPDLDEAVPLGAAILAGIGVGIYKNEQDAYDQVYKPGQVYEPDGKLNSQYAEWFKTFEKIYPALRNIRGKV